MGVSLGQNGSLSSKGGRIAGLRGWQLETLPTLQVQVCSLRCRGPVEHMESVDTALHKDQGSKLLRGQVP